MKSLRRKRRGVLFKKSVVYFLTFCLSFNAWLPAVMALQDVDVIGVNPLVGDGVNGLLAPVWGDDTVIETANGAIINWNTFDTSPGQSVTFNQYDVLGGTLDSTSAVLNRIASGSPTQFDGALTANGRVFIVNPAGIVFGGGSTINVTQLIASSLNIADSDFSEGIYEFDADNMDEFLAIDPDYTINGDGSIVNYGQITADDMDALDGFSGVVLLAKKVLNSGTIVTEPGGFVVMAAGDRVLLGEPGSKILVEMDSVTLSDPENPDGLGEVVNDVGAEINAPGGTVVLAAGDIFSIPWHPQLKVNSGTPEEPVYEVADQPVRVESGIGTVTQSGTINADGIDGDGGSVVLTGGDEVVFADGSLTTANGGVSNDGADGGEVIAYASELYGDDAIVDFQADAHIEVRGGAPSDPTTVDVEAATFEGGLAELSGDHLYFDGSVLNNSVDATSLPFDIPDPEDPEETITITPEGGTLHIDPVNLTLANGPIPTEGAAMDTFYEEELEAYSQAGVNTILEADYDITVEHMTDEEITGGSGDIVFRTVYNTGTIVFLPEAEGEPIATVVKTIGGGNIYMLAGGDSSGTGIKTGRLETYEDGGNPGRIRIFTNNGGSIETRSILVDGGNDVEVSIIASGDLTIDGSNDDTNKAGVRTSTNKVPELEDQTGSAYICLVSENGSVNIIGAVDVEAHGKEETVARIHICADGTVNIDPLNGRVRAVAKTSSAGTADAQVRIHAGSDEPGAITVEGDTPIRVQANTSGSSIGPLDFADAETDYEQTSGGSHVSVQIADGWTEECPDCPTPPDLLPPVQPPERPPIAVDDFYTIGRGDTILIIFLDNGVLVDGDDGEGADYDPDSDPIIAILVGGGETAEGGTVTLNEDGSFEYTPPEEKPFDEYGSDEGGDYAVFTDTFTYQAHAEGDQVSNEATVTITAKNYIPVANPDVYYGIRNEPVSPTVDEGIIVGRIPAYGDYDPDGDSISPFLPGGLTEGSTAQGGYVTLNPDGSFMYNPPTDWIGTDSFSYYVGDGYGGISESVQVSINVGVKPLLTTPAPGLAPVEIETSGCPGLVKWAAQELGVNAQTLDIGVSNSLALGQRIQPCDACGALRMAAKVLQDAGGLRVAALRQVINEFAPSDTPPTEEQMATIAEAITNNVEANNQRALAGEYLDALAAYLSVISDELGFTVSESIQVAMNNYVDRLILSGDTAVAAFIAARLTALEGI